MSFYNENVCLVIFVNSIEIMKKKFGKTYGCNHTEVEYGVNNVAENKGAKIIEQNSPNLHWSFQEMECTNIVFLRYFKATDYVLHSREIYDTDMIRSS